MKILPVPELNILQKYWFHNNPSLTHFMSALSVLFLEGERFFMRSVTSHKELVPHLLDDITIFCKQEANHGRLHHQMNATTESTADLLLKIEAGTKDLLGLVEKYTSKKQRLLITTCLEHLTSILGNQLLNRTDLTQLMKGDTKKAWIYHAKEEVDHKSVSFDVFKACYGNCYLERCLFMPLVTLILAIAVSLNWVRIMNKDGYKGFSEAIDILFFNNGFITTLWNDYKIWFKKEFHPEMV